MRLENWRIHNTGWTKYVITGNIYEDNRNRFTDGDSVTTSALTKIDFINKKAFTLNSEYDLGDEG